MAELSPLRGRKIAGTTIRDMPPATRRSRGDAVSKFSRYLAAGPSD